jgi:DNA (cytosine-5)-methyltransferase 1
MKILSLFSGAGGLDLGFHQAGFELVGCVELEKIFCATLRQNAAKGKYLTTACRIFDQDIATFAIADLPNQQIDFIIGGPPCQTYSAAGRRIGGAPGLEDPRGQLFEHYCNILHQLQPRGFLFENVRGLFGVNNGAAWKAITQAFSELGYKLSYRLLDAAAYGVPQHRERIILVGTRNTEDFLFPHPLYGPDSLHKQPYVTAGSVLADLQDPDEPYHEYDGKYGYLLAGIPEGLNYSFYTSEMGHPNPVFAWRSKFSSFLYKVAQEQPVKTIQAQLGKFAGPFHWKNRRLTVAELKRLQSFPDDYEFCGSYDQINRQIGNSVPPRLAEILAQAVVKQLFDTQAYPELELMPTGFKQTFDARKAAVAAKTRATTKRQPMQTAKTTAQLTMPLFSGSDTPTSEVDHTAPERFILKYSSATKREKIAFEQALRLLEARLQPKLALAPNENWFDIETKGTKNAKTELGKLCLKIRNLKSAESHPTWQLNLKLFTPLKDSTQHIEATLYSDDSSHLYVLWDAIEEVIKQRSAYISLVALYGHFAEPKIKFQVSIENLAGCETPLAKLLEFVSNFENCGRNLAATFISERVKLPIETLPEIMQKLRAIRYDIRSHQTSPRIPPNTYFCAYPFPELSAEYQLRKPV